MIQKWNEDKKHRCPSCHAWTVDMEKVSSLGVYTCCRCSTKFTRWPALAPILRKRGIRCSDHRGTKSFRLGD